MQTDFATSGDYRISFNHAGNGPELVLFMHGVGSDKSVWDEQVEYFGKLSHYTAAAFEYRGYGSSTIPPDPTTAINRAAFATDAFAVMDRLGFKQAHLVGLSLGGVIALEMWQTDPARVTSMVLADSFVKYPNAEAAIQKRLSDIDRLTMPAMAAERVKLLFAENADPAKVASSERAMANLDRASFRAANIATWSPDYTDLLPTISVPTLILVGDQDRITPLALSQELQSRIPGAKLQVISPAGHLSNLDRPEQFNQLIESFLPRRDRKD